MEVINSKFTRNHTKVKCEDEWKYNAPHHFTVVDAHTDEALGTVNFQEGPVKDVGVNGIFNEDLLLMVVTRLEAFQNSETKCNENQEAINAIYEAIDSLRARTVRIDSKNSFDSAQKDIETASVKDFIDAVEI
jgi:hypothetical protein